MASICHPHTSEPHLVKGVDLGACCPQETDDLHVSQAGGDVQRRAPLLDLRTQGERPTQSTECRDAFPYASWLACLTSCSRARCRPAGACTPRAAQGGAPSRGFPSSPCPPGEPQRRQYGPAGRRCAAESSSATRNRTRPHQCRFSGRAAICHAQRQCGCSLCQLLTLRLTSVFAPATSKT